MSRRLQFALAVLAGLGGAALAAVLWSGTAYASTPPEPAVPQVRVPAPPSLPVALPRATAPHATPPLPPAPLAVPPAVPHALANVAPVVDRTLRTVPTVAPVELPLVATPAPARTAASTHLARRGREAHVAGPAATLHTFAADGRIASSAAVHGASPLDRARAPVAPRHHAPARDLADDSNRAPQTANGMPFAITRAPVAPAGARCDRTTYVTARSPGSVPLRDVARPG